MNTVKIENLEEVADIKLGAMVKINTGRFKDSVGSINKISRYRFDGKAVIFDVLVADKFKVLLDRKDFTKL